MADAGFVKILIVFLFAAVAVIPLFRRLGLGSVLGYLAAGTLLGPSVFNFVPQPENVLHFAEFGVVILLFLIGLELKPSRLWVMRKSIFGLGGLQVLITSVLISGVFYLLSFSLDSSLILGIALSLSSTAFAIQILTERNLINTQFGRNAFSILLFQDIAAIPVLALIPLIAAKSFDFNLAALVGIGKVVLLIALLIAFGRFLLPQLLRLIASAKTREVFTAAALLLILAVSYLMQISGLSMALGSFLAGLLLSDSEFRHQLEADMEPFKGLLLGLFFMGIGMSMDLSLLASRPFSILGGLLLLIALKYAVVFFLGKKIKLGTLASHNMALVLAQGGEFAFVVFAVALQNSLIDQPTNNILIIIVTLSMVASSLLIAANEKFICSRPAKVQFDEIKNENNNVIIAGFGRFGQITGRLLRVLGYNFTALEIDPDQVEVIRKFGNTIYYGDASRLELLESAGAKNAKFFILAIDDIESSLKTARMVKEHFPHMIIFARARNRNHHFRLRDLGVTNIWRETFFSSLEMSESLLRTMGIPQDKINKTMITFVEKDLQLLDEQYKVYTNQEDMIATSKQATQNLIELLSKDIKQDIKQDPQADKQQVKQEIP